jgi:hypothetical protein
LLLTAIIGKYTVPLLYELSRRPTRGDQPDLTSDAFDRPSSDSVADAVFGASLSVHVGIFGGGE